MCWLRGIAAERLSQVVVVLYLKPRSVLGVREAAKEGGWT